MGTPDGQLVARLWDDAIFRGVVFGGEMSRYKAMIDPPSSDNWKVFDFQSPSAACSDFRVIASCRYQADAEHIANELNAGRAPNPRCGRCGCSIAEDDGTTKHRDPELCRISLIGKMLELLK